jgi:hypothetical protein
MVTRIGKTELALLIGGSFVSPSGAINSRKLCLFVSTALNISETEYKASRVFTAAQIEILISKKVVSKEILEKLPY